MSENTIDNKQESIPLKELKRQIFGNKELKKIFRMSVVVNFNKLTDDEFVTFRRNKSDYYSGKFIMKVLYYLHILKMKIKLFFIMALHFVYNFFEANASDIVEEKKSLKKRLYTPVDQTLLRDYFERFLDDNYEKSSTGTRKVGEHTGEGVQSHVFNPYLFSNRVKWKSGKVITNKKVRRHEKPEEEKIMEIAKDSGDERTNSTEDSETSNGRSDDSIGGVDTGSGGESESGNRDD